MTENKPRDYCKDCPGPQYFLQEDKHVFEKISQICRWKDAHEIDQKIYREKRELREENRDKEIDNKFATQKNWAIGVLTSLVLLLIGQIITIAIIK